MYDKEVCVTVCASTYHEIQFWVRAFDDFFGATTQVEGSGVWDGITEQNVLVSHLYDSTLNEIDWDAFDVLVQEYKWGASQAAVLVVWRAVDGNLY